jgi:hypothetical protein
MTLTLLTPTSRSESRPQHPGSWRDCVPGRNDLINGSYTLGSPLMGTGMTTKIGQGSQDVLKHSKTLSRRCRITTTASLILPFCHLLRHSFLIQRSMRISKVVLMSNSTTSGVSIEMGSYSQPKTLTNDYLVSKDGRNASQEGASD